MRRPRLKLTQGNFIECVGTSKSGTPYLFVGDEKRHLASGPIDTGKRASLALETFLRRSLEAVTGKTVMLK